MVLILANLVALLYLAFITYLYVHHKDRLPANYFPGAFTYGIGVNAFAFTMYAVVMILSMKVA